MGLGFNILKRLLQQIVTSARPNVGVELKVIQGHPLVVTTIGICIHFPHLPNDLFQVIIVLLGDVLWSEAKSQALQSRPEGGNLP